MKTKKICIFIIVFLFTINSIYIIKKTKADETFEIQKPNYEIGDYWEFEFEITIGEGLKGHALWEITDSDSITIEDSQYDVLISEGDIDLKGEILGKDINKSVKTADYLRKTDLAKVKSVKENESGTKIILYNPPFNEILWPIKIGEEYTTTTYYIEMQDSDISEEEKTFHVEITGTEYIYTPAGDFNCYIIKISENKKNSDNYQIRYYSPDVGWFVKIEEYTQSNLVSKMSLITYGKNDEKIIPIPEINSPSNSETVSEKITIKGNVLDSDEVVQKIQIKFDSGTWKTVTGIDNWYYNWDTTDLEDGLHVIKVRSFNGKDYSEVKSVSVFVENEDILTATDTDKGIPGFELILIFFALLFLLFWKRKI